MDWNEACHLAAEKIDACEALLITAGAGMGVDSGLPDFRGNEGFWKAYPPFAKLGLSFSQAANPKWFFEEPRRAWGFYGHRFNLYSRTTPHSGFQTLKKWCRLKAENYFVFTSNVDGHFQKAGFDGQRIVECHGSINHWAVRQLLHKLDRVYVRPHNRSRRAIFSRQKIRHFARRAPAT